MRSISHNAEEHDARIDPNLSGSLHAPANGATLVSSNNPIHRTGAAITILKSERIRLKKARDLVQNTTGQMWSAERFTNYLKEHNIDLVKKEGQPCHEFAQVDVTYGTAAIELSDLNALIAFFEATSQDH